eukprot:4713336-Pleurochrysis_carterae.AAC.2
MDASRPLRSWRQKARRRSRIPTERCQRPIRREQHPPRSQMARQHPMRRARQRQTARGPLSPTGRAPLHLRARGRPIRQTCWSRDR